MADRLVKSYHQDVHHEDTPIQLYNIPSTMGPMQTRLLNAIIEMTTKKINDASIKEEATSSYFTNPDRNDEIFTALLFRNNAHLLCPRRSGKTEGTQMMLSRLNEKQREHVLSMMNYEYMEVMMPLWTRTGNRIVSNRKLKLRLRIKYKVRITVRIRVRIR